MNNIRFLRKASQELDEAVEWYNQQSSGLGIKFLDEVDKGLRRISIYPYSCVEIRRCLVSRFPYGLIYGMDEEMIVYYCCCAFVSQTEILEQKNRAWEIRY